MDPSIANLPPGDPKLINSIGSRLKSQGLFDQFRKHCLSDIDTKPAYQNLRQRVEGYVNNFLQTQQWRPDLNKNQLRDSLRRHINESGMLAIGVDRIVEQVVNPKVYQVFYPQIESVVFKLLGKDLPTSGSFMQKCLDNNAVDPTNPEVPGEEKTPKKEETSQESLQKIIGFTDDTSNTSATLIPATSIDQTPEIVDVKPTIEVSIKVELDSTVPMKASVETQTDITPSSESTSKDGLTTDSSHSDDGKESSDTVKKKNSSHDEKKDGYKKSGDGLKTKTKDSKKMDKSSKLDKSKHSSKQKTESKVHGDVKVKSEDGSGKIKKVVTEKEKSKSSSSQELKSPKHKSGDKSTKSDQRSSSKSGDGSKSMKSSAKSKDVKLPKAIKLEKSSSSESEGKSGDKSKKSEKSKEHNKKVEKSKSDGHLKHKSSDSKLGKSEKSDKVKPELKITEKSSDVKSGEKNKPKEKEKEKIKTESHSKDASKSHGDKNKSLLDKNKSHDKNKSGDANKIKSTDGKSVEKPKETKPKVSEPQKEKEKEKSEHKTSEKINKKSDKEKPGKIISKTSTSIPKTEHSSSKVEDKIEKSEKKFKKIKVDEKDMRSSSPEKKISKRKHSENSDKSEKKSKIQKTEDCKPTSSKNLDDNVEEKEKIGDGNWSDVTVSSVHTSDLSDYDDHISLTDSEMDNTKGVSSALSSKSPSPVKRPRGRPRKDQSQVQQQIIRKQKIVKPQTSGNQKDRDPKFVLPKYNEDLMSSNVDEPRRELRRQRKVNPRYSSDEFASIFSKGKDKLQFQHDEQEEHRFGGPSKDTNRVTPEREEFPPVAKIPRGRKSTVSSVTSDQPYSPRSDISEAETPSRRHSKERESGGRPLSPKSDMSTDSAFLQGPRTPESTCSTESKRRQHYDSSDLYKPRPTIRGGRRNRGSDQRYDDSDLYKPRPQITSSRRARGISPTRNLENSLPLPRQQQQQQQQQKTPLSPEFSPEARSLIGSPVESIATTPNSDKTADEIKDLAPINSDDDFKDERHNSDDEEATNSSSEHSAKRLRISLSTENDDEPKRRGAPRGRRRKSSEMASTRGRKPRKV